MASFSLVVFFFLAGRRQNAFMMLRNALVYFLNQKDDVQQCYTNDCRATQRLIFFSALCLSNAWVMCLYCRTDFQPFPCYDVCVHIWPRSLRTIFSKLAYDSGVQQSLHPITHVSMSSNNSGPIDNMDGSLLYHCLILPQLIHSLDYLAGVINM